MSKATLQRELRIYTALVLPTVTSDPSLKSLQWTPDGQVCYITKSAAFILTPDHGINFDAASAIESTPPAKDKDKDDSGIGLRWFKTMIQTEKATPVRWPEYSQAWGAVSLGSIDLSLISMAISPSGVGDNGGCVFATLSSNMDITLWSAGKNYLKGEWIKISDVTSSLLNHLVNEEDDGGKYTVASVLQAQIVDIEWTAQPDFGILPMPNLDASLLVLGSRAGYLTFLRHRIGVDPDIVASICVADKWITQIAFSCWELVGPGRCSGYVAYAVSDGSIGLVKVTQTLNEDTANFSFSPSYDITVAVEHDPGTSSVCIPEWNTCVTALRWVLVAGRSPILVYATPGLISLYSASSPSPFPTNIHWSGTRTLPLETQRISTDASALHAVSGLTYLPREDCLIITLFDGSFHVLSAFAIEPVWASRGLGAGLTSEALSRASRTVFVRAERERVDRHDMMRVNGAVGYDAGHCFMWVYESSRPSDFSYKHDAKHSSTLVVAQMWDDEQEEGDLLLKDLAALLKTIKISSGQSPLNLLRPFLLYLRQPSKMDALHAMFLNILRFPATEPDHPVGIVITTLSLAQDGPPDAETRRKWRKALASHLFGWDELLRLRMRLSLADFAWKMAVDEQRQVECGVVAQGLLNTILHRVLRTVMRHLVAVVKLLTANDIPFVSRMIVQSLLPGCPLDLSEEGRQLSVQIQPFLSPATNSLHEQESPTMATDELVNKLNELCPACSVEVPLQDITTAVCANGHNWARCSVTTFILSTPWVRTCVGCSRKAFLPPSAGKDMHLPLIAQGWVVEDLLEAVKRCLFCGNAFVIIL